MAGEEIPRIVENVKREGLGRCALSILQTMNEEDLHFWAVFAQPVDRRNKVLNGRSPYHEYDVTDMSVYGSLVVYGRDTVENKLDMHVKEESLKKKLKELLGQINTVYIAKKLEHVLNQNAFKVTNNPNNFSLSELVDTRVFDDGKRRRVPPQEVAYNYTAKDDVCKELLPGVERKLMDVSLKPHQVHSVDAVCDTKNTTARSGVVVLPCGSGKTLVGVQILLNMNKSTLILCTTGEAVLQWEATILRSTQLTGAQVKTWTGKLNTELKDKLENELVLITTYQTFIQDTTAKTKPQVQDIRKLLFGKVWGLVIFDEAHMVPAPKWSKKSKELKARVRLGLTATLVREDEKENDIYFLIGPRVYEENWKLLEDRGILATTQCLYIPCPAPENWKASSLESKVPVKMDEAEDDAPSEPKVTERKAPAEEEEEEEEDEEEKATKAAAAAREAWNESDPKPGIVLGGGNAANFSALNPYKYLICEYLVREHERRGHKILVFGDNVRCMYEYAKRLKRPIVFGVGNTPFAERKLMLEEFRSNPKLQTLLVTRIGDNSLDLPGTQVVIQVTSFFASRVQEAQRLGRVLRPKDRSRESALPQGQYEAYFYTLVSTDFLEAKFMPDRQQYLQQLGYTVVTIPVQKKDTYRSAVRVAPAGLFFHDRTEPVWLTENKDASETTAKKSLSVCVDPGLVQDLRKACAAIGEKDGAIQEVAAVDNEDRYFDKEVM